MCTCLAGANLIKHTIIHVLYNVYKVQHIHTMSKQAELSLSGKFAVLTTIRSQPRGMSHRQLSEQFGIPNSTISEIIANETMITQQWKQEQGKHASLRKRKREGMDPEVEEALTRWFKGVRIGGPILNRAEQSSLLRS